MDPKIRKILSVVCVGLFEMMTLAGADLFMDSVRAEAAGILVVSALSSAITVWLDRKDEDSPGNEIKENKHGKD